MKITTAPRSVSYLLVVGFTLLFWPVPILAKGETKLMLDDMSQFFEGTSYPSTLYEELAGCMQQWGVQRMEESQDAAWQAFYDFYLAGGAGGDAWGTTPKSTWSPNSTGQLFLEPTIENIKFKRNATMSPIWPFIALQFVFASISSGRSQLPIGLL
jgi:hypothetical protein